MGFDHINLIPDDANFEEKAAGVFHEQGPNFDFAQVEAKLGSKLGPKFDPKF